MCYPSRKRKVQRSRSQRSRLKAGVYSVSINPEGRGLSHRELFSGLET